MTLIPILAVFYFTTIFFGGDLNWVYSIAEIFILSVSLVFLLILTIRAKTAEIQFGIIAKDPVTIAALFFLALVALQLFPWPSGALKSLSPMSFEVWKRAPLPEGSFFPVSVYPYATQHGLIFAICLLIVYWWVLYGIKNRQEMEKLAQGIVIFGALVSLYGLFETVSGRDQILWWKKSFGENTVTATFFNRNHLATFLSMTFLIGVGYFWYLWTSSGGRGGAKKIKPSSLIEHQIKNLGIKGLGILLSLVVLVFTLLSTASRGGNLSTLAGLILMTGLITPRFVPKKKVAAFALLIMTILAFGTIVAGNHLWERLKREPLQQSQSTTGISRSALNRDTWAIVRDYPLIGSGFNTFPFVFTRYAEHSLPYMDHAHNDWLEAAAESGLAGMLIILAGLLGAAWHLLRTARGSPDPFASAMALGGLGVLLSVSLNSLADFGLHKPANAVLLASILGLASRAGDYARRTCTREGNGSPAMPSTRGMINLERKKGEAINPEVHGKKLRITGALLLLLGGSVCLWGGSAIVRSFILNLYIPIEYQGIGPQKDPDLKEAIRAINIDPDNSVGWAWLSKTLQYEKRHILVTEDQGVLENARSRWAVEKPGLSNQAYQVLLTVLESLARRPVSPHYWYEFIQAGKTFRSENPSLMTPMIVNAFDQVLFFNPRLAIGYLERGIFSLQAGGPSYEKRQGDYRDDLKKSLILQPGLIPDMIENLTDLSIPLEILTDILPKDNASVWISAGQTLLEKNQWAMGEKLYLTGEAMKINETNVLSLRIKKLLQEKRSAQIENLAGELKRLDPDHPWLWYVRGETLKALEIASQRGWPFQNLDEVGRLRSALNQFNPGIDADRLMVTFYLALLDLEQQDYKEAATKLDLILQKKPNYYPALLARRQILNQDSKGEADKILYEKIENKIALFSLKEIPSGAWVAERQSERSDEKTFRAVLRNDRPLSEISLMPPMEAERWIVFVESRMVAARQAEGKTITITLPAPLFPGEHQVFLKLLKTSRQRTTTGVFNEN